MKISAILLLSLLVLCNGCAVNRLMSAFPVMKGESYADDSKKVEHATPDVVAR